MKIRAVSLFLLLLIIYVFSLSRNGGLAFQNNQDNSGSPFSSGSCGNCHSGGNFSPSVNLTVLDSFNNPVTSYKPNALYTLKFQMSNTVGSPAGYGLQATGLKAGNTKAGNINVAQTPNSRITSLSGRQYAEHNGVNSAGLFQFTWNAPATGSGNVTFYYTGIAANGNNSTSGDKTTTQVTKILTEACLAPVANFSHTVNGGQVAFVNTTTNQNTTWSWTFGDGGTSTAQNPNHTYTAPGNYTVCLTAGGTCGSNSICKNVFVSCTGISLNLQSQSDPTCHGDSSGSIVVSATGGLGSYTFTWSNGSAGPAQSGLPAGSYTITVTDSVGCQGSLPVTLNQPPALQSSLSATDVECKGDSTGFIQAVVSGGNAPYSLLWSNSDTGSFISGLEAGTYALTVQDANGCTHHDSIAINEPLQALAVSHVATADTSGLGVGSIDLTVSGGTPPYEFLWNNFATSEDLNSLHAGVYTVLVLDSLGCSTTDTIVVDLVVGVAAGMDLADLSISPNPTRGRLFIEGKLTEKIQVSLWDIQGNRLQKQSVRSFPLQLDLNELPKGTYLLRFEGHKWEVCRRIVLR
ncbi:MAG: T9SS type A sorting domain-containing protein [Bacteroidia bacterium]|nr:T9SS type A sorting domain-containing protein [Bacteroidia bacterium]